MKNKFVCVITSLVVIATLGWGVYHAYTYILREHYAPEVCEVVGSSFTVDNKAYDVKGKQVTTFSFPSHDITSKVITLESSSVSDNKQQLEHYCNSTHPATQPYISEDFSVYQEGEPGIDIETLWADISDNAYDGKYYTKNYLKEEDKKRIEEVGDTYNKWVNWHYMWTSGDFINNNQVGFTYTASDNSISYNKAVALESLKDMVKKMTSKKRTYVVDGVEVSSGTWGTDIDMDKIESDFLQSLDNLAPVDDVVIPYKFTTPELPDQYLDVNISKQKVTLVSGNSIVLSANCVTGRAGKHDTPTGVYYVSERKQDKVLRGPGYASHVNYWMRLTNQGVGLHDATWRSNFGGEIYKTNGSHGCINLPMNIAKELYSILPSHACVVVHK